MTQREKNSQFYCVTVLKTEIKTFKEEKTVDIHSNNNNNYKIRESARIKKKKGN